MKNKIAERLRSAEYTRDYRPIPFWSWNDKLDKKRLCAQIEWMHGQGIGGFFMHARGGLLTEYLGEEWMECCDVCCEKAAELDMDAYMYDENGWPSGFAGGKLLENENNRDRYLTHSVGEYDETAYVSYELTPEKAIRTTHDEKGKRYLNVYLHMSVSTVDILNPDVTEQFLDLTHRSYKKRYGAAFAEKLKGFFTDEPQYFRWETAYSPMIDDYFRNHFGKDVLDGLGLLFVEKEGYEKFRYQYWSGMQALFLKNFSAKLYNFCEENGMLLTGHYVEERQIGAQISCCGGVMPFYALEHIPGIDWLGRDANDALAPKQAGSVAAQTGKSRVITETFGCCGWDVTPRELKRILDWQYLDGVNVMCHHLIPSSEYGQRKRDYPQHYTPLNPWINRCFKRFNEYYTRLGALLGHSTECVNTCLLHPITSAYLDFKEHAPGFGTELTDSAMVAATQKLNAAHIPHHYIDEVLLRDMGDISDRALQCGKCTYRYWLLPSVKNISLSTYVLLQRFLAAGGKLLFLGDLPRYLDGEAHTFDDLHATCTWEDVQAAQLYTLSNPLLRATLYTGEDGIFVFVVNPSQETQRYTLHFTNARSVRHLDLDTCTLSEPRPLSGSLRAGQSMILYPSDEKAVQSPERPTVRLRGPFRVIRSAPNTLMIDSARIAREDEDFGENTALVSIFSQLLEDRYKGKLRLRYEFETRILPRSCILYAEDMNTEKVEINGIAVQKSGTLPHEPMVHAFDIARLIRKGKNEITVTLNYYQDDSVYYALFGEGVTDSLRNCMAYRTALESVYLAGDFGVYPIGLRNGQTDATVLCDGFVLDTPKSKVVDFITDGYPTAAGEITLETQIDCDERGCLLELGGRWQTVDLEINNKTLSLLLDNAADISHMVHPGKNTVRITITPSLRNLLGPHHYAPCDELIGGTGPYHFDLAGSWKNGKSRDFSPSYSLVHTKL